MGYMLSSLGNLPVDDQVRFYLFIINGQWEEPLYRIMEQNFASVARSIGKHAVIAKGLKPEEWYGEVAAAYFGEDYSDYFNLLPALLLTNAHPAHVSEHSMRLLVPLRDVDSRFGGWPVFFQSLTDFVQLRNDEFLTRFQRKEDAVTTLNRIVELRPGAFGIGININEVVTWWRQRKHHSEA